MIQKVEIDMERIIAGSSPLLFWLDCEMTGLDVEQETIIEIGIKVSDSLASFVIEGPSYVIHATEARLQAMGEWCRRTHTSNGLWEEALVSSHTLQTAEQGLIEWIRALPYDKEKYLAGSSIWCDRMFIRKEMPLLDAVFHYRMVDVSSLKWVFSHALNQPYQHPKSERHRVMEDVDGSIKEYRHYLDALKINTLGDLNLDVMCA